ncbi:MAG: hydrogenase maturation protease [Acidobacteriota bacterium]|nr:hydrogenase maturation protease [Acidobacteriota bacterium]
MTDDGGRGPHVALAGIGNSYRRDDGAGIAVAARVVAADPSLVDVGPVVDPLDLLGRWDDSDLVVVVDAVRAELPAGTVVVEALAGDSPSAGGDTGAGSVTSSHGIAVPGVLRLARAVGRAPGRVVLVGIVGSDFASGTEMSLAVRAAVPEAARRVLEIVAEARPCA